MSVLIPVLVVLLLAGSFMWLKPSKRDQRLAKIRSDALVNGFRIGSLKVPDTSENGRVQNRLAIVTVYQLPFEYTDQTVVSFTALRTTGEAGIHLPAGWQWDDRSNMSEIIYKNVSGFLSSIPESISVISIDRDLVSVSWDEKDPDINFDVLKKLLVSVADATEREIHPSIGG